MPDIETFNNVDMADIASFNGQTIPSGGGGGFPVDSTGLLVYGLVGGPNAPLSGAMFDSYITVPQSYSIFALPTGVSVVHQMYSNNTAMMLLSNGDLYSTGSVNSYLGRPVNTTTPAGEWHLSLQNVSKASLHYGGMIAVKTDGTLWITGTYSQLFPGINPTYTYYTWLQYGTDTDWIDVKSHVGYPYAAIFIKGGSGAEYAYACGLNNYGLTGQGLTSGSITPTRIKTAASTDLTETFNSVSSVGANAYALVSTTGKLYTGGQNSYGRTAHGTASGNTVYATQVGTDTNWAKWELGPMGSFGIKTNGTLYTSMQNSNYYELTAYDASLHTMSPVQVGTDTDYEDVYLWNHSTGYPYTWRGVLAKKSGTWYVNGLSTAWNQPRAEQSTAVQYTWYDLKGSDIETPIGFSQTIDSVAVLFDGQNTAQQIGLILGVS